MFRFLILKQQFDHGGWEPYAYAMGDTAEEAIANMAADEDGRTAITAGSFVAIAADSWKPISTKAAVD